MRSSAKLKTLIYRTDPFFDPFLTPFFEKNKTFYHSNNFNFYR